MESTAAQQPVRIFLVGLSEGFARSLARYVSGDSRLALVGVAPSRALASALLPITQPDLALLDWSALTGSPRDAVQMLRSNCPCLRIVCVVDESDAYGAAAAQAGADAVISGGGLAEELEPVLRALFTDRFK